MRLGEAAHDLLDRVFAEELDHLVVRLGVDVAAQHRERQVVEPEPTATVARAWRRKPSQTIETVGTPAVSATTDARITAGVQLPRRPTRH